VEHCLVVERENLSYCVVCHGAEGSLPTNCPGRPMTMWEEQRVYAGTIDYDERGWHVLPTKGVLIRMLGARGPGLIGAMDSIREIEGR
jgi:mono/diheme cytochrome c family protein